MTDDASRRAFVVTSLAAGFALTVAPDADAETITTDAAGLVAGEIAIGSMPAYRAMPEGAGKLPMVLVVQEIFGVHEHIRDLCRRLAKAGYLAIAPELFARHGDVSKMADIQAILHEVVAKVPDAEVLRDLDATVDWAKASGKLDGDRVAIAGFCWGGRIAWLYGASRRAPKAGAAWYGRLSNATNALQTKSAMDIVPELRTPILGLYGGHDAGIPVAHVDMMKKELADAHKPSEIVLYPDAGHGFNADYRPSYNKAAAEDAWRRMLAWFRQHGV